MQIDMLLDEYEACKRVMKEERGNKMVKGFLKRTVEQLKALGYTTDKIKAKTSI